MAMDVSRPVRCEKCGGKFTRTHGRQKFCLACIPNWRRTRAALRQADRHKVDIAEKQPKVDEPFTYEDMCRLWGRRTAKLIGWRERTGLPLHQYRDYRKLTAREVSVAIGWVPWPESWPREAQ